MRTGTSFLKEISLPADPDLNPAFESTLLTTWTQMFSSRSRPDWLYATVAAPGDWNYNFYYEIPGCWFCGQILTQLAPRKHPWAVILDCMPQWRLRGIEITTSTMEFLAADSADRFSLNLLHASIPELWYLITRQDVKALAPIWIRITVFTCDTKRRYVFGMCVALSRRVLYCHKTSFCI